MKEIKDILSKNIREITDHCLSKLRTFDESGLAFTQSSISCNLFDDIKSLQKKFDMIPIQIEQEKHFLENEDDIFRFLINIYNIGLHLPRMKEKIRKFISEYLIALEKDNYISMQSLFELLEESGSGSNIIEENKIFLSAKMKSLKKKLKRNSLTDMLRQIELENNSSKFNVQELEIRF